MRLSREELIPSVQGEGKSGTPETVPRPHSHLGKHWEDEEPLPEARKAAGAVLGQSAEVSAAEPSVPRQQPSPAQCSSPAALRGWEGAAPGVRLIHSPHS